MQMNVQHGDLLSIPKGIIVHGCNAQGVMGSGVAALIRAKWPLAYREYHDRYETVGLKVGQVITAAVDLAGPVIVANAVTQEFYGREPGRVYVDYEGLSRCFEKVADIARQEKLSVHYPLIGCGLAGGKWAEVKPRIEKALEGIEHTLWLLPGTPLPK